jgi:beta-mannosidase
MTTAGEILAEHETRLVVDRLSQASVDVPPAVAAAGEPGHEFLVATTPTGERTFRTYVEDKDLAYAPAGLTVRAVVTAAGYDVSVTAQTFTRHLCLFADRLHPEATVDDMLVTLLPGETHTFAVECPERLDLSALTAPTVLRCINDVVTGR